MKSLKKPIFIILLGLSSVAFSQSPPCPSAVDIPQPVDTCCPNDKLEPLAHYIKKTKSNDPGYAPESDLWASWMWSNDVFFTTC